jgi:hypothetical protein
MSTSLEGSTVRFSRAETASFLSCYHGHPPPLLRRVATALRFAADGRRRRIAWLVGDSSLDNKYWLSSPTQRPANGLDAVLAPGTRVPPDVAQLLNEALEGGGAFACVNCAVEESTLASRAGGRLLAHDEVVRDLIEDGDAIIVSVGGNDIALAPSVATIASLCSVLKRPCPPSASAIESGAVLGISHLDRMFGDAQRDYVASILSPRGKVPSLVAFSMIYYPLMRAGGSWADAALQLLGYNADPRPLQLLIRSVFERVTSRIELPGVKTVGCPLYEVLDAEDPDDFVARVEPSAVGGRKMAAAFAKLLFDRAV